MRALRTLRALRQRRVTAPRAVAAAAGFTSGALIVHSFPAAQCDPVETPNQDVDKKEESAEEDPFKDGPARFLAYLARVRTLAAVSVTKGVRYLAYSSDVGESLRPVLPPWAINGCYAIAFAYVGADVAYVGWSAQKEGKPQNEVTRAVVQEFTFQTLASLLIPTVIIHTAVHQTQHALKTAKNATVKKWLPSAVGMAIIPLMPYIDHPMEHLMEEVFHRVWPLHHEETAHDQPHVAKQEAPKEAVEPAVPVKAITAPVVSTSGSSVQEEASPIQCDTPCKVGIGIVTTGLAAVALSKMTKRE